MDVDVILFDVGGTVFDWRTAVVAGVKNLNSPAFRGADPEAFADHWRRQSLIEIEAIAEGSAPWRPFDPILESSLTRTLSDLSLKVIGEPERRALLTAWEEMPVWPGVPESLARLRRRYFVAPHTILSLHTAAFSSCRAGIAWDAIVTCDALGATKPAPESYLRALAAVGRPAERVCFAAAHPGDLRAAQAHGMRTAYIVARLHDYGDDYEDTGFAHEFDVVADDFAQLAELMGV
ncbi:MAG: HAD family hydrolase [Pseudomonadota bacterium]